VSEQIPNRHISTNRLYSVIHIGTRRKIRTEDRLKTDITKTKHNPEKANNTKHSKTKLPWFSRLLRHSARKRGGLILQRSQDHTGLTATEASSVKFAIHFKHSN